MKNPHRKDTNQTPQSCLCPENLLATSQCTQTRLNTPTRRVNTLASHRENSPRPKGSELEGVLEYRKPSNLNPPISYVFL